MKEIIINITADATMASGHKVVIPNAADYATFGKNNVLGILNKTRTQSHFTPMQWANLASVVYDSSAQTLTLNLAAASYPITAGDELFVKLYSDDAAGSYDEMIANWLGITEATDYTALTPAEAIAIARDCQYNVMGTDWPIPTWLPTGVTEAQVESAAEGLGIPYHEPTQTA